VLVAIRIDTVSELAARLDGTEIFALEELVAERFSGVLTKDDAYTIWLELGFGVLVHRDTIEEVEELAKRICASVADEPFLVAGAPQHLTVSVGVALPPRGNAANGADRWFASAHAAQAIALRHGGNRHDGLLTREYEPIPAERVLIIREWLQEAKAGENVMIEFQPVLPLNAAAARLYSVHAKLRDYRAPLGGVYRREYLQLAREVGAMVMIDRLCLFGAFEALEQERARGFDTRLLVPVELATLEGMPWRWLEAELGRRRNLVDGLILELDANQQVEQPENVERMMKLREFGVRIGLCDRSGGLDRIPAWSALPVDILRLQVPVVDAVPVEMFRERLAPWREQGRQLIVDSVENAGDVARFTGLGVDYLRGQGLAAIGPRLDFEFG
jgi:EAL domain-containing protein (putative c-di-GMP-specific phosphodiesterase class I)